MRNQPTCVCLPRVALRWSCGAQEWIGNFILKNEHPEAVHQTRACIDVGHTPTQSTVNYARYNTEAVVNGEPRSIVLRG